MSQNSLPIFETKKESAWTPSIRPDHSGLFYSIHSYDRVTSGVRKREV